MADTPEIVIDEIETPPEAFIEDPNSGMEDLRRQLEEANNRAKEAEDRATAERQRADEEARRREQAQTTASQATQRSASDRAEAESRQYDSLVNAIQAGEATVTTLKAKLIKSQEDGDFATSADLQVQLGRAAANLSSLETGKATMEEQRKTRPAEQPQDRQPAPRTEDVNQRSWTPQEFENVMRGYSTRTASWMRNNPRYGSDVSFRHQVQSAHGLLVAQGIQPDTDDYFRRVEELTGVRQAPQQQQQQDPAMSSASKPTQTRSSTTTTAAPPSRNVPTAANPTGESNVQRVQLTPNQRAMARQMYPDIKDPAQAEKKYAEAWLELKNSGRLIGNGTSV